MVFLCFDPNNTATNQNISGGAQGEHAFDLLIVRYNLPLASALAGSTLG
jgi:hypothetical protein